MALRTIRKLIALIATVIVLVTPSAVYSCGPWLEQALFVPESEPQVTAQDFAAGKLGVLLPTFRPAYLLVAYRYLSGLPLNADRQKDVIEEWNRNVGSNPLNVGKGDDVWRKSRNQVVGLPEVLPIDSYALVPNESYERFLNCPEDAFRAAAATLTDLIQKYGSDSSAVREWVTSQDQVFKNCDGRVQTIPSEIESKDSLLRAGRKYQIAAAKFYAQKFDEAAAAFDAIAKDSSSPWAPLSPYLAARALIRKATLVTPEQVDVPTINAAALRLQEILGDSKSADMQASAHRELDYVRFRTEPTKRVAELEGMVLKPDPDSQFRQHVWDYLALLSRGERSEDLSDWLKTFCQRLSGAFSPQQLAGSPFDHAINKWREGHSLPWLIAALELAAANDKNAMELLTAAQTVPASSPGYLTVRYYAFRLMLAEKRDEEARKQLDVLLRGLAPESALGTRNLFNDQRLKLATSLGDFLAHAAEIPNSIGYEDGSSGNGPSATEQENRNAGQTFFTAYAAEALTKRIPLELLIQAAQSSDLSSALRREVARGAWMRAVILGDLASADKLQPLLKELDYPLWMTMEPFRSEAGKVDKQFAAIFIALQNPGLSPSVRFGLLRSATLGEIDNYQDNWWCNTQIDRSVSPPSFLSAGDRDKSAREQEKLEEAAVAPNYLTLEVLRYAKQHPDNPTVPQALHLAVRATRYGCKNTETTVLSERAFKLLHLRYPKSEWSTKTKYYF